METYFADLRGALLELAWGQWTAAGVAGVHESAGAVIDPEALLVACMSLGRHDARLFDEVADWLVRNARMIDLARLRRLAGRAGSAEMRLLATVADLAGQHAGGENLARMLGSGASAEKGTPRGASPESLLEPLFYSGDGTEVHWGERDAAFASAGFIRSPLRLRGLSGHPKSENPACLRFRVRALAGVGTRSEVLVYLLTHEWAHGRLIAERGAYGQAPVAAYLAGLLEMRLVDRREEGKKVLYRLADTVREVRPERALFVDWVVVWPALNALLEGLRPSQDSSALSQEAKWVRAATALAEGAPSLRAEGLGVEVGDLRGWALGGPEELGAAVSKVISRVRELAA